MKHVLVFAASVVAQLVSMLAARYAEWLLAKIADGVDGGFTFLEDLPNFGRWLMRGLARRSSGCGRGGEYDRWQPELFGG